jgi:hypothetical protein
MFNPLSSRIIVKDGTKYLQLLEKGFTDINNIITPRDTADFYTFEHPTRKEIVYLKKDIYHKKSKTLVVNPKNGKNIEYKTALTKKDFTVYYHDDKTVQLIPHDKHQYEKVKHTPQNPHGYWIRKMSPQYKLLVNEDMIDTKMVYATKNRLIPVSGEQFKQMIMDGYTYDEKINVLKYPVEDKMFVINGMIEKYDVNEIMALNPNSVALIIDGSPSIVPTGRKAMRDYINNTIYYTLEENRDALIEIAVNTGGDNVKISIAFDGERNCVIQELERHFTAKGYIYDFTGLYKKYKYGVYGSDYETLSRMLMMSITIKLPLGESLVYGKKREKRSAFSCMYNNHHVSMISKKIDKETVWVDSFEDQDIVNIVNMIGKPPTMIETDTTIFRLKTIDILNDAMKCVRVDLHSSLSYGAIGHYAKEFLSLNNLQSINGTNFNIDALRSICQHGIMFQKKGGREPFINYDLKKAYTSYDKCHYYSGFPKDLTYCVDVQGFGVDEINKIITLKEGFVLVLMTCIWTKKQVVRWISFPYYRFYQELRQDPITPLFILISYDTVDKLNIQCCNVNKRMWHCILGYLNKTTGIQSYITKDPQLASTGKGYTEKIIFRETDYYRKNVLINKVGSKYYPYLAGYVQNYTEIILETFVIENKIPIDSILRVWVDGIYVKKDCPISLYEPSWWNISDGIDTFNELIEPQYKALEPIYYGDKYDDVLDVSRGSKILLTGVSGTGKTTHVRKLHKQIPNSIVLVPNNELKKQYPNCKVETIDMVLTNPYPYKRYNTHIIDEYSMVPQEKIDMLDANLTILSGDLGQLGLTVGTPINIDKYYTVLLEKIHRQHDHVFQAKLNQLRVDGSFKFNQSVSRKDAIRGRYTIVSSTHIEIDKLNKLGLMLNDNELIKGVKIGSPVRFYKTNKGMYNAGELGVIVDVDLTHMSIKKEDGVVVRIKNSTFQSYHKLAYSMTYHAVQGKTIRDGNVAINQNKLFDKKMKYVGCSRVVREDQLFLLIG